MKLVFYAQVIEDRNRANHLVVAKTTKGKPTGPEGHVIKFDIDIPEGVLFPEVRATLVGLETATEQVAVKLRNAADSLKASPKPAKKQP